jgi:ribonuclease I
MQRPENMSGWLVLGLVYAAIAVFAACMTHHEQRSQGRQRRVHAVLGYVLCGVWPLVVAAMLVQMSYRAARSVSARTD